MIELLQSQAVKTVESIVTVEDFNDLFHNFGHSDKEDNINNDANSTEKDCKPDQVRMSGLSTQPTSKNDYDTLTADPTVVQQETESKSATQTHVEAGFNHKKSNSSQEWIVTDVFRTSNVFMGHDNML